MIRPHHIDNFEGSLEEDKDRVEQMINEIKNFFNSHINQEIGELARIRIPKEKLIDPFFEQESFYIEILDSS
jgi:hypothetical protein